MFYPSFQNYVFDKTLQHWYSQIQAIAVLLRLLHKDTSVFPQEISNLMLFWMSKICPLIFFTWIHARLIHIQGQQRQKILLIIWRSRWSKHPSFIGCPFQFKYLTLSSNIRWLAQFQESSSIFSIEQTVKLP